MNIHNIDKYGSMYTLTETNDCFGWLYISKVCYRSPDIDDVIDKQNDVVYNLELIHRGYLQHGDTFIRRFFEKDLSEENLHRDFLK